MLIFDPVNFAAVTRVEVIDHTKPFSEGGGRSVVIYPKNSIDDLKVELQLQDDGRTLKLFVS